ncbi:MAG TPA: hypothetical protein VJ964_01320 [Balneolaceae bacterium]|nr:hypothetical protein [Balneolaceae bacterium]
MERELHVFEEGAYLFWGLVILICAAGGTFMLTGSFVSLDWDLSKLQQLAALGLYLLSFWGIFKVSDSHYHLIIYFEGDLLVIIVKKGTIHIDTLKIPVKDIEALKFSSHYPRSSNEALFDFSKSYHLMYRAHADTSYRQLFDIESGSITLKVDDIANIMRFITERNPEIKIPREQAEYFNL